MNKKIAIIGGGASGLAAAISCARRFGKGSTVILERQQRTGRKLLATGNGRCNITNENVSSGHYHGDKKIIESVLSQFTVSDLKDFFLEMSVILHNEDDGRVYPYSNSASTVLDAMRFECEMLGVEELCNFKITSIINKNRKFYITSEEMTLESECLIFATGSQASPMLGANDSGYKLLHTLGIEYTQLFPALSPVMTKEKYASLLKGVRAKGSVTLTADGRKIKQRNGEIQFTDYGLSGICVFEISRFVNEFFVTRKIDGVKYNEIKISVDLMKDIHYQEVCDYLRKCKKIFADKKAADLLSGALNKKLSHSIAKYCNVESKICSTLSEQDIKKIAGAVKNFVFTPIFDSDGYKSAQVSAGGIDSRYVDPKTLMSKKIKNLFICGELLNVDGECGGYNLHFAFGSGVIPSKYLI